MSQTPSTEAGALFLCLDTSTPTARVAILDGEAQSPEAVRFSAEATAERHAGHLLPLCAEALRAVGVAPAGLAGSPAAAVRAASPGSASACRRPRGWRCRPASRSTSSRRWRRSRSTFSECRQTGAVSAITAVPCLDAGKGEVYVAAYVADPERLVREVAPSARLTPAAFVQWVSASALARPLVAGNGAARHKDALRTGEIVDVPGPTAVSVGRLALLQRARGEASDLASAVPFYGRPPDITVKKQV